MPIPQEVKDAYAEKDGFIIFTTVDKAGVPNSVYVLCTGIHDDKFIVADNKFDKTKANLCFDAPAGHEASILFYSKNHSAYQLKGTVERLTEGPAFEDMLTWTPESLGRHAAAVMTVREAWSGARRIE